MCLGRKPCHRNPTRALRALLVANHYVWYHDDWHPDLPWVNGERVKAFSSRLGLTQNRVQQTELSHFAPPPLKQKFHFMNLARLLEWANMVSHHLSHPKSEVRVGITADRMRRHKSAVRVAHLLVEFVERSEQDLGDGERAWLSTEILESLFGRFEQLEGQQSKGGFTSLLAGLLTLYTPLTQRTSDIGYCK